MKGYQKERVQECKDIRNNERIKETGKDIRMKDVRMKRCKDEMM